MTQMEKTWAGRKLGAETSITRLSLVNAAHRLVVEEGYSAVTSRRVAAEAGLKPQLVHYYFRSMDDLLLDVLRQGCELGQRKLEAILDSDQPLRAIWEFISDPRPVAFTTEFTALAGRNAVIRDELAQYAERFRAIQTEAIARHLKKRGIEPKISPMLINVLLVSLSVVLVRERALGMTLGHAEAEALVEECLQHFQQTGEGPKALFS
jgi:AcrR family transcriptional regulator